jgi:hypothetical protein
VDWYPEEQDELNATRELYTTLTSLLSAGYQVDLVNLWHGAQPTDITTIAVSLGEVSEKAFRLFENHKFRLHPRRTPNPVTTNP